MGQLIEIVFEDLSFIQAKSICMDIACNFSFFEGSIEEIIENRKLNSISDCLDLSIGRLAVNSEISISNVHLRLLNYEEIKYDVELNFDLNDICNIGTMKIEPALHEYASNLANRNYIENYFSGLEPACDKETRFFTKNNMGPYRLPIS